MPTVRSAKLEKINSPTRELGVSTTTPALRYAKQMPAPTEAFEFTSNGINILEFISIIYVFNRQTVFSHWLRVIPCGTKGCMEKPIFAQRGGWKF
jgi:hypothetical protein